MVFIVNETCILSHENEHRPFLSSHNKIGFGSWKLRMELHMEKLGRFIWMGGGSITWFEFGLHVKNLNFLFDIHTWTMTNL